MCDDFKFIVFTNNANKLQEIREILAGLSYAVLGYRDVFDHDIEVEEDGLTFQDNAIKKVQALPDVPGAFFLAEDSGLEIDALNGRPGVFSARYGGDVSFQEKCEMLLAELHGVTHRSARFRSVMALRFSRTDIVLCEGVVEGSIAHRSTGELGFGYDPIFIPQGYDVTFAQMAVNDKHLLSHRGKSLKKLAVILKEH